MKVGPKTFVASGLGDIGPGAPVTVTARKWDAGFDRAGPKEMNHAELAVIKTLAETVLGHDGFGNMIRQTAEALRNTDAGSSAAPAA